MRTVVIASSLVAAAVSANAASTSAPPKKGPLITTGVVGTFLQESVFLTRDLTLFTASYAASAAWGAVPAEQQKLISDQYNNAWDQMETLRLQNGLMKPSDLVGEASSLFHSKVVPAVQKAYDMATKMAEKPFGFLKEYIVKFEQAYPAHEGLLSSVSIWDCLLTLFFVVYYVLGYSKRAFCYFFCCGMCRRRAVAKPQPQLVKKTNPLPKANGISKKR